MEQIEGAVSRIVNISPTGGAIFRILLEGNARTVRVVAPSKATPHTPTLGESWVIFGSYMYDRKYGRQFQAAKAIKQVPSGSKIINLLASNPLFAEFGASVGRRLWRQLGAQTYALLNGANHIAIARAAGLTQGAAVRLIQAWRFHCAQIQVSTYLAAHALPLRLTAQAMEFWGQTAADVIAANPYVLAPFTSWKEIDAAATTTFGMAQDSPLRLIAACASSVDKHFRLHMTSSIPIRELQVSVRAKLGSSALAAQAIDLSVEAGAIFVSCTGKSRFAQSRGQHIIANALKNRLSELASQGQLLSQEPDTSLPGPHWSVLQFSAPELRGSNASVTALSISSQDLSGLAAEPSLAGAVHIFSSFSQKAAAGVSQDSTACFLLGEFLRDYSTLFPEATSYVIHGADDFDLVTACKLIHAIPGLPKIFAVTTTSAGAKSASPFVSALCSIPAVAWATSANSSAPRLRGFDEYGGGDSSSPAQILLDGKHPTINITAIEPAAELNTRILSTYRRATATSTALIVTTNREAAKKYNDILHDEHIEVRKFERVATPLVQLSSGYTATIGDAIVFRHNDYSKGILAGSIGKITNIVQMDLMPNGESDGIIIAHAFFDTVGDINLSASDCRELELGYAVPAALDKWSCYAVRIVCVDDEEAPTRALMMKWMSRTTTSLYFAGLRNETLNTSLSALYQSQIKARGPL